MSDFVDNGVAKVQGAFEGVTNVNPVDVARVILEYIEEQQAAAEPAPAASGAAAKGNT